MHFLRGVRGGTSLVRGLTSDPGQPTPGWRTKKAQKANQKMNTSVAMTGDEVKPASQNRSLIAVIRPAERFIETSHGFDRFWGVSQKLSGAEALTMADGRLPAHMSANPHSHAFETAIRIIAGKVRVFVGDDLLEFVDVQAGDFITIPANVTHAPANLWKEPMDYIVARATPIED